MFAVIQERQELVKQLEGELAFLQERWEILYSKL
jgi:hypothetical protein